MWVEPYISFSILSYFVSTAAVIVVSITSVIQPIICLTIHSPTIINIQINIITKNMSNF